MWLTTRLWPCVGFLAVFALVSGEDSIQNRAIRSDWEEDPFVPIVESLENQPESLLRNIPVPAYYESTSPYQVIPGSYELGDNSYYLGQGPYNQNAWAKYLASGAYSYSAKRCANHYGQVPEVLPSDVDNAFHYANEELSKRYPEYGNGSRYKSTDKKEVEGTILELVSEFFGKHKCFSKYQLSTYLPAIQITKSYELLNGAGDVSCTPYYNQYIECAKWVNSKYRSMDGACNNLIRPYWGRSNVCHIRLLPADYADGVSAFRLAKSGRELPLPRDISNFATPTKDFKAFYTSLTLGHGQLINHDMTFTVNYRSSSQGGPEIDCCKKPSYKCEAISVHNGNDYLSAKKKGRCLNFVRSSPCPLCKLGAREHLNSQTSFLDGSVIYGATNEAAKELRSFKNGQLKVTLDRTGKPVPPTHEKVQPCFSAAKKQCFLAGDRRANQHPILLSMHIVWMRNHNQHALKLKLVNPHWNDEKLFQEARRIVVAELQHITYGEYLPIIMGSVLSGYYSLNPLQHGYTYYEPNTDPTTWNEYGCSAGRYGHSQMKDIYRTISPYSSNASQVLLLKENFHEPGIAHEGLIDDIVRGIISEVANTIDPYYSLTAKNFVGSEKGKDSGNDMVSTNTVRGRDQGMTGYVHWLNACFNYQAKSWKDLEKFIPAESLGRLRELYEDIEDIDLYVGGVSEKHFIDASVGPTVGCLVGIQFYHTKFGDRYYYEHSNQPGSFSPAQLENIRHTATTARVFCQNLYTLREIQPKPFYLPSGYNPLVDCSQFADINYGLWKE